MAKYRALVSIEFDSNDLRDFAMSLGVDRVDASEAINGEIDNFSLGCGWLEQLFRNGEPTIHRLGSNGISVVINDHDLSDDSDDEEEDEEEDEEDFDDDEDEDDE